MDHDHCYLCQVEIPDDTGWWEDIYDAPVCDQCHENPPDPMPCDTPKPGLEPE